MKINNLEYEVYLEGYLIPGVISINISENIGGVPAANITIAGGSKALRLLSGTIMQIFGEKEEDNVSIGSEVKKQVNKQKYLLYEGKITSINYSKSSDSGEVVNINTISMLSEFYNTKLRPADAVVYQDEESATSIGNFFNIIKNNDALIPPPSTFSSVPNDKAISDNNTEVKDTSGIKTILTNEAMNFAQALGKNTSGAEGNFFPFFKKINTLFKKSDILYAINSKSLELFDSIFVFPNPGLPSYFQNKIVLEAIQNNNSDINMSFGRGITRNIISFFNSFKSTFYYKSLAMAAPTASNLFYSNHCGHYGSDTSPIRDYYLPNIESGPPALTNIIFPQQILSLSFSHDLLAEPTRLIMKGSVSLGNVGATVTYNPTVVVPDFDFYFSGANKNNKLVSGFTEEELYKGVVPIQTHIDGILNQVLIKEFKEVGDTGKEELNKDVIDKKLATNYRGIAKELVVTASRDYLSNKFSQRTIVVTTSWSPNYVIGLPGLVFSKGMPSFVGIVNKVEHSISSDGSAVTRVAFEKCRVIYDEEMPDKVGEDNPLKDALMDNYKDSIIMGGWEYIYNSNFYNFFNLGKYVYSYIISGHYNKTLSDDVIPDGDNWAEFSKTNEKFEDNKDYSILTFIKNSDGQVEDKYVENMQKYYGDRLTETSTYEKNGFYLTEAIKKFKETYYKEKGDKEQTDKYNTLLMYNLTNRNIIKKEDYLNYIGGNNPDSIQKVELSDTKDLIAIINKKLEGEVQFLKEEENDIDSIDVSKVNSSEVTELQKELDDLNNKISNNEAKLSVEKDPSVTKELAVKTREYMKKRTIVQGNIDRLSSGLGITELDDVKNIFRPYNKTRKAHVIESFKDFKKVFNTIIKEN